jgi:hypothetical protein
MNIYELYFFYKECPYNYSYNQIAEIFNINYPEDYNKNKSYTHSPKCNNDRCLLMKEISDNSFPISYLCNYNSEYYFNGFNNLISKIFSIDNNNKKSNIDCIPVNENNFNQKNFTLTNKEDLFIINAYYTICSTNSIFYKCNRYEKPKTYEINNDFSCPNIFYNIVNWFFGVVSIFSNFFFPLVINIYEFIRFKKILILYQTINDERASTRLSTKNSSEIKKNINNNITNNNNEIIIIEPNSVNHQDNNYRDINRDRDIPNSNRSLVTSENIINVKKKDDDNNKSFDGKLSEEEKKENDNIKITITDVDKREDIIEKDSNNSICFNQINMTKISDNKDNRD